MCVSQNSAPSLLWKGRSDLMNSNVNTTLPEKPAKLTGKALALSEIFDWVQTFCQALFAVVLLFTFFFRFVTVDGHSMDKTLADRDRLIISGIAYTPERGDIVVIHATESQVVWNGEYEQTFRGPIIKRVIATEGETVIVDYDNWQITVIDTEGNTHVLEEPYVNYTGGSLMEPNRMIYPDSVRNLEKHVVQKGHVFVCGDNRANSLDSRYIGDIDTRKILGKALWRVFPFQSFGVIKHVEYTD